MATAFDKLMYETAQRARVGWYTGQKLLAGRFSKPVNLPARLRGRRMPGRERLVADLRELLERDWRNIEAGLYAMPEDWDGGAAAELRRTVDFFADLGTVERRRHGNPKDRVLNGSPDGRYPRYYLQNFHFQSDGYLSEASAERYDHQVEVLFGGGAAAMRRQALVPLRTALLRSGGAARARLLDVACGTGAFLREVKRNYPRLRATGLDLSAPYLAVAGRRLADWSRVDLREGAAEDMPFDDSSFDVVTCIYLMHELPPRTRRAVAAEIARVLKPGGTLVLVDSLQTGDVPDYDGMLDIFPVGFHEPYYASYLAENLDKLCADSFRREASELAYFSKVLAYRRIGDRENRHNM